MRKLRRNRLAALICLGVLVLALAPVTALAGQAAPPTWPIWYEGHEVTIMLGPSGNSSSPHQAPSPTYGNPPSPCYGFGPDFSDRAGGVDASVYYNLRVPGTSQMMCPDGSRMHDMVLTKAPGDPGYTPFVRVVFCDRGPNFSVADMPMKSAAVVEAAIAAGKLVCQPPGAVYLAPVLGPR